MIPKILHQVWLGPDDPPLAWMRSWIERHPDWRYLLWHEQDFEGGWLGPVYDEYMAQHRYDGASDVARAAVLYAHGGVYVDADSECLRPLPAELLALGFWAGTEPTPHLMNVPLVSNAFIAAQRGHTMIRDYMDEMAKADTSDPETWLQTGPGCLTRVMLAHAGALPPETFYPEALNGKLTEGRKRSLARHHWTSTRRRKRRRP